MHKICSKCELNPKSGTSGWCNSCRALSEAARRISKGITVRRKRNPEHIKTGLKECFKCDKVMSLSLFGDCKRGTAGKLAWCRGCCNQYGTIDGVRQGRTANVQTYRNGPKRGQYLVQHRNHQQKRRAMKEAGEDGTVTTMFMLSLYETKHCYYCLKYTAVKKRTADHKTPLARQGKHSTDNLVMACSRCNSSKSDKTEKEFQECMKQKSS
jgi:5-methylcytosine-specific restriction endonuclease McrA